MGQGTKGKSTVNVRLTKWKIADNYGQLLNFDKHVKARRNLFQQNISGRNIYMKTVRLSVPYIQHTVIFFSILILWLTTTGREAMAHDGIETAGAVLQYVLSAAAVGLSIGYSDDKGHYSLGNLQHSLSELPMVSNTRSIKGGQTEGLIPSLRGTLPSLSLLRI